MRLAEPAYSLDVEELEEAIQSGEGQIEGGKGRRLHGTPILILSALVRT